jgi:outer membrane receptor protein involved in Fe transport
MARRFFGPAVLLALAWAGEAAAQARADAPAQAEPADGGVEAVVVTARRPAAQTLLDRKVYTVTQDLQASSGVAADVLNKIPSVNVDADGVITLRGDSNVTILVDGKPSAQFVGAAQAMSLLQFPASDIERIEVLTNPPAQYRAEGSGGVINIVTRKTRRAGLSGAARASLGDKRRYVVGVDAAYNSGPLRLSGGLGMRQDAKERLINSDTTTLDPTSGQPVRAVQSQDERFRRKIPSVNATVGYDLGPTRSIDAAFSHRETDGIRYFDQHDTQAPLGGAPDSVSDRHSDGHEWNVTGSEGLTFEQKLGRPNETLTAAVQRSVYRERERYAYSNSYALPPAPDSFDDLRLSQDLKKAEYSLDYDLPMAADRELRLGYDHEADRNDFDDTGDDIDPVSGQPIANPAITNHFRYRQDVDAAYADYQRRLGEWRLDAGLRLEATHVTFVQLVDDVPGGRNDFAAYPSLHLDREVGDNGKISAAVSRRVTRPPPEALNPFVDTQDTHNLRAGNPNLKPQDTWSYELGWRRDGALSYGVTGYYRFDRNSITEIVEPVSDDVVLATKQNLPKRRSAGVELTASGRLGRAVSFSLSADLFHAQVDATALGAPGLASTTGANLKASVDWRPTSADDLQISFSRIDKLLTPQGYVDPVNLVNLGYKHDLTPALSLVATVTDLFNGQRQIRHIASPTLTQTYERHQLGRVAYLGAVYSFGGRKKKAAFDYDQ